MGAWAFGAGMGGGGGADPIMNFSSPAQSRPMPFSAQGQPGAGRAMGAPQQPATYQPIIPQGQPPMAGRMAPGQPGMQGSYVPPMQGMPQPNQIVSKPQQMPLQAPMSQGGAAQAQLGQHSPNSIPGGKAVGWRPYSLGEITGQINELLQHGTVKGLMENNKYFQKLYSNLPEDMKVGLLKSAAMVGQPSNSQIDAQSMSPSRQMPGQRSDLIGQAPAVSANNTAGLRSPSIMGGNASPVPAMNNNMNPQTQPAPLQAPQLSDSGLSTTTGADAHSYTGLSPNGLAFIQNEERFSPKAYWDYKQYSIGYGTKASSANATITKDQALEALQAHVSKDLPYIQNLVTVPLTQNQVDALLSFSYNLGPGVLKNSKLIKLLNQGDYKGAAKAMLAYNKAGGKINKNLIRRRQAEMNMFLGN